MENGKLFSAGFGPAGQTGRPESYGTPHGLAHRVPYWNHEDGYDLKTVKEIISPQEVPIKVLPRPNIRGGRRFGCVALALGEENCLGIFRTPLGDRVFAIGTNLCERCGVANPVGTCARLETFTEVSKFMSMTCDEAYCDLGGGSGHKNPKWFSITCFVNSSRRMMNATTSPQTLMGDTSVRLMLHVELKCYGPIRHMISSVAFPSQIPFFKDVDAKLIAAGNYHSVVVFQDGSMFTFGDISSGQLGRPADKNTSPMQVLFPTVVDIMTVSAGSAVTHVGTSDGRIFAMGDGDDTGLDLQDVDTTGPTLLDIPIDDNHAVTGIACLGYGQWHGGAVLVLEKKTLQDSQAKSQADSIPTDSEVDEDIFAAPPVGFTFGGSFVRDSGGGTTPSVLSASHQVETAPPPASTPVGFTFGGSFVEAGGGGATPPVETAPQPASAPINIWASASNNMWKCQICSCTNDQKEHPDACQACSNKKGDWVCRSPCNHINPPKQATCMKCGAVPVAS
eukprot:scaffold6301_cov165-Amphora_coffeaeformis.AAC.13